jgi:hypothetical protein
MVGGEPPQAYKTLPMVAWATGGRWIFKTLLKANYDIVVTTSKKTEFFPLVFEFIWHLDFGFHLNFGL